MLRFLLAPRQLLLHGTALLLLAAMAWLSLWQLDKARNDVVPASPVPVPLVTVSTLGQPVADGAYNKTVTATGRYDTAQRAYVGDRQLDGRLGRWSVVPLRLADGGAVAVVRGWYADDSTLPAEPDGELTVSGRFLPPEENPRAGLTSPDQLAAVDLTTLESRWPYPLHEGFVLAAEESLAGGAAAPVAPLVRIPESNAVPSDTGAPFSNLGYALQWWAFSAFVGYLWWRILRDRWRACASTAAPARTPAPPLTSVES